MEKAVFTVFTALGMLGVLLVAGAFAAFLWALAAPTECSEIENTGCVVCLDGPFENVRCPGVIQDRE